MARIVQSLKLAAAALFLSAGPLLAGDWSITGNVTEKLTYNDNSTLVVASPGWTFSPAETLTTDFGYTMQDGKFDLIGSFTARNYFGPGNTITNDAYLPKVQAKWEKRGPRTTLDASASYAFERSPFSLAFLLDNCTPIPGSTLFECDGEIVDPNSIGFKHVLGANFSWSQKLDQRDTLTWTNSYSDKIFTVGAGANFQTYSTSLAWNRLLTKRLDGNLKLGVDWLGIDDVTALNRFSYSASAKLTDRLTNRLTINAIVSGKLSDTSSNDLALPGNPRVYTSLPSASFKLGAEYLANGANTFAWTGSISTAQQTDSQWFNSYLTTVGWTHKINETSTLNLATSVGFADALLAPAGKQTVFNFSVGPTYSLVLARNWNLLASYKFALRNSASGTATSNEVGLTISHDFVAVP